MKDDNTWRPFASIDVIERRAVLLQQIRSFMSHHGIIEVDTPILSHYAVTDPYIESIRAGSTVEKDLPLYLHTSPEFCMKRLLAAGSGSIYQIAHVFRDGESGKRHKTEFSMLEWYRTGFGYEHLMNEVTGLLGELGFCAPEKMTYQQAFLKTINIDPHAASNDQLWNVASQHGWEGDREDRHALLDYLFSVAVIQQLEIKEPLFIYDYPDCMAALATLKNSEPVVAERFELFINGMEIANGFNELVDAEEQRQRFTIDSVARKNKGVPEVPVDNNFLNALEAGIPECAGVAIGIDRLLMVLCEKDDINDVLAFSLDNN